MQIAGRRYGLIAAACLSVMNQAKADLVIDSNTTNGYGRAGSTTGTTGPASYNVSNSNGTSTINSGSSGASSSDSLVTSVSSSAISAVDQSSATVFTTNTAATASGSAQVFGSIYFHVTANGTYNVTGSVSTTGSATSGGYTTDYAYEANVGLYDVDDDQEVFQRASYSNYTGYTGTSGDIPSTVFLLAGKQYEMTYYTTSSIDLSNIVSSVTGTASASVGLTSQASVVPGPGSFLMVGSGLAGGLAAFRRRRGASRRATTI